MVVITSPPNINILYITQGILQLSVGQQKQKQGMKVILGLFSQTGGYKLMKIAYGPGR